MNRFSKFLPLLVLLSIHAGIPAAEGRGKKDYIVKEKEFYKTGQGDAVKNFKKYDFEAAKSEAKPLCIYIYDPEDKNATRAKLLEDPFVLGSDNVKTHLEHFLCVKLTADAMDGKRFEDARGWPAAWLMGAKSSASLIIASSDLRMTQVFDKNTPKQMINNKQIAAVLDSVLKYEAHLKAEAEKAAAKAAPSKAPAPQKN